MTQTYHDRAMEIAEAMRREVLEKYRKEHPENPGADLAITDVKREANRIDIYVRIEPEPPSEIHLVAKVVLN